MSSQTPNLDLVLPVGTENVSRQIINDNNTKIDTAVGLNSDAIAKVQNGLAYIVGDTNTTGGTLAVGQFVYVKNHSSIAEGLRKVTASISANGSITTNNTTECSEGGLNALNSKIANLSNVAYTHIYGTSLSEFETSLTAAFADIQTNGVRVCPAIASYSGSITAGSQSIAFLSKPSSGVLWAFLIVANNTVKTGYYTNSAWTWL